MIETHTTPEQGRQLDALLRNWNVVDPQMRNSLYLLYRQVREGRTVTVTPDTHFEDVARLARKHMQELLLNATEPADARQAGGDHYKKLKVQPWDAMEAWLTEEEFRGFLKGNIIKYLARANSGKEDHNLMIEKAAHYQQKLDEMLVKWKSS